MPAETKVDILLVDDSPGNLLALEAMLAELGQNLVKARSGSEALKRLPPYATALGESVGSGSGFMVNLPNAIPNNTQEAALLDLYFQPGKIPDSLSDLLRGFINERLIIKPKSP